LRLRRHELRSAPVAGGRVSLASAVPAGGLVRARILGTGHWLPPTVRTNQDIERLVDTSDTWIRERTGIGERRLATEGITTSEMGAHAAEAALDMAGVRAADLDLIVVATVT